MEAPGVEWGVRERGLARVDASQQGLAPVPGAGSEGSAGAGTGREGELATVMRVVLEKLEVGDVETAKVLLRLAVWRV
jgi:hypothetical protein